MSDTASLKVQAEAASGGKFNRFLLFMRDWAFRNKIYFLAFLIPAAIMYIAYAIFGIYPFGGESVLVLDLNGQYVYYFEALRDAFWSGDESIFYDWSRNLSGGYMGVIGYYLASPFTLIVLLLPRKMLLGSLLILQLAKLGCAGLTFCYYLRKSKGLSELQALLFSMLYALCAYGVIQLIDPMWLDGLVFLPLIILGVEYLVDDGRKINYIIPLGIMFIANFYIGYMIGIFTFLYYVYYAIFGCNNAGKKNRLYEIWQTFVRFGLATVIALACAAIMLLPVYNALKLGKFDFTEPDFSYSTQFKPLDFFAQLTVAQYDSVNVQGLPEIYCGILTLFMTPLFFLNKEIKSMRKAGYLILLGVLFLCMYINPIDMAWHGFQEPNWLPYRYSFTFSFVMLSMAAEAFKNIKGLKIAAICGTLGGVLALLLIIESGDLEHITAKNIWICAALAGVYCAIVVACNKFGNKVVSIVAPILILVVSGGELLYNCVETLKDEDKEIVYSERKTWYNYINNGRAVTEKLYDYDDSYYRAEKTNTYFRTVNDCAAFGLRGISHSNSVMNAKTISFLEAMGYDTGGFESSYNGASPVIDSLLGIKYAMDRNFASDVGTENYKRKVLSVYDPAFTYSYTDEDNLERLVDVYENPYALSFGYMVDEDIRKISFFGNDNPFKAQNTLMSTLVGKTDFNINITDPASHEQYYKQMEVNPDEFILNNVDLAYTASSTGVSQRVYTAMESGDPTVDMFITPTSENPIYMFFKTESETSVNLWLSTQQDDAGNYTAHKFVQSYFEGHDYHIVELGKFEPGKEFNLRMTVANNQTIVKDFFFYEFDEALFAQDIERLRQSEWQIEEFEGDYLSGTVTAAEGGQIMLTSIPYEEGWKVKVDGKSVEVYSVADALIGFPVPSGTHTVEMSYTPPGFTIGVVLLIIGIAAIVVVYRYDKKNNKVLIAMYRAKNQTVNTNTSAKAGKKKKK